MVVVEEAEEGLVDEAAVEVVVDAAAEEGEWEVVERLSLNLIDMKVCKLLL